MSRWILGAVMALLPLWAEGPRRPATLTLRSQRGVSLVDGEGHAFRVRVEGVDPIPGGVRLKLRIGNLHAAVVEGFTLRVTTGDRSWDAEFTDSIEAGKTLEVGVLLTDLGKVPAQFTVAMQVEHWGSY